MARQVQYVLLLDHHSLLFRQPPPLYNRDPSGQWTCDYWDNRTVVLANQPGGRQEAARLMWILIRILHPFPQL